MAEETAPNKIDIESFSGVWKRTKLYEPRGCLGPEDEQTKIVLWFQSSKGIFIDIRIDAVDVDRHLNNITKTPEYNPLKLKSFAGESTYDSASKCVTWNRAIDYRPVGAPDIGLIHFNSEHEIEEDGVLVGDDYKEIWNRITINETSSNEFVAKVTYQDEEEGSTQFGYFIVLSDRFAFTLSKPTSCEPILKEQFEAYFDTTTNQLPLNQELEAYLKKYITIVGSSDNWIIDMSLDSELVGQCLLSSTYASSEQKPSILKTLFASQGMKWEVIDGSIPPALAYMISS